MKVDKRYDDLLDIRDTVVLMLEKVEAEVTKFVANYRVRVSRGKRCRTRGGERMEK